MAVGSDEVFVPNCWTTWRYAYRYGVVKGCVLRKEGLLEYVGVDVFQQGC